MRRDCAWMSRRLAASLVLAGLAVCSSPAAEGRDRIYIHGEKEFERRRKSLEEGVYLDPATWERLDEYAGLLPKDAPGLVSGGKPESFENERYRNVSVPQLFVYLPVREKARGTALIIAAGGGYAHLGMCLHVENVVKLFNDRGIAVFGRPLT